MPLLRWSVKARTRTQRLPDRRSRTAPARSKNLPAATRSSNRPPCGPSSSRWGWTPTVTVSLLVSFHRARNVAVEVAPSCAIHVPPFPVTTLAAVLHWPYPSHSRLSITTVSSLFPFTTAPNAFTVPKNASLSRGLTSNEIDVAATPCAGTTQRPTVNAVAMRAAIASAATKPSLRGRFLRARPTRSRARDVASALGRGNVAGTSASCRSRSSGMAVFQLGSQCGARTAQPGHDRPDGDLENRRDLFDTGVQPVVEDDDGSLPLGQVTHGPDERVEQLRVVLERSNDAQLGHPRVGTLLPLLAPQLIDREVDRDPLQPGSKRARRVEAVERAERTENRILRDVVGKHPVTRDAVGPVPDEWPEAREELVDRRFLARAREGDQLRLVHVSTIRPWGGANFPNAAGRKGSDQKV